MPHSDYENRSSFDLLHPEIQRWIWDQKWEALRTVQDETIRAVLTTDDDVLISAPTAAGKTEAAFLPALTAALADNRGQGLAVLYISPLKALINDQFRRLEGLCESLQLNLVRWHGDAPQGAKQRLLRNPKGIALITPESIEAMFLRRSRNVQKLLGRVKFIVIDELHSFMQGARGLHLFSLLRRIDAISSERPRRLGLSATIGDLSVAAAWLNEEAAESVQIISDDGHAPELKLQVRAYPDPEPDEDDIEAGEPGRRRALDAIADHVFEVLRGDNHLMFAGSRRRVEALSDRLVRRSAALRVPNEFFPHHGSLSKLLREELEERLKAEKLPTTAVATTTLELGIDVGSVKSVAQVGAPRSMSSLRQRLGRSGRRAGSPAILRIYVREPIIAADSDILDRLHLEVVRSVAAVRLLIEKFIELPRIDQAVATVVLHQVLSVIAQRGGAMAHELFDLICQGPLGAMDQELFVTLLRGMSAASLVEQAPNRTIMLGRLGEVITSRHDFYAVFQTDQEWRLISSGRELGTIPIVNALGVGSILAFAGHRWRVVSVDDLSKVLEVAPHRSAKIPKFDKTATEPLDDRFVSEMRTVYRSHDQPAYLDGAAREVLSKARRAFFDNDLDNARFLAAGKDTHIFTWRGSGTNAALAVALAGAGLECAVHEIGITVLDTEPEVARELVGKIGEAPPNSSDLADFVENLQNAKYDEFVPDQILRTLWAKANAPYVDELASLTTELLS